MKQHRIVTSLILTLVLVLSLLVSVFAADANGTITVENPVANQSYYVYRIFDLESYNKTSNAYSYTINNDGNDAWKLFLEQDSIRGTYVTLEPKGSKIYVNWVKGADVKTFAKLAIEWAKEKNVPIVDGISNTTTDSIVFKDLPLGYYLIDSSVGALCALTTTDPNAVIQEKNEVTTIEKKVKENSTNDYGSENSAKIGDTISFRSEVTLGEGAEKLKVYDKMDTGLTLKEGSFKVYIQQKEVPVDYYTVTTTGLKDGITFVINFRDAYISTLNKGTVLRIEYDAVLNSNAKVHQDSNNNTTWVTFGDNITSEESTTKTYSCQFELLKTDEKGNVITMAKFYLYDAQSGGNIIPLIAVSEDDAKGIYVYRVATAEDKVTGSGAEIKAGYATILGLDKQVYYLEETQQPTGFNKLAERVKVDLTNGSITTDHAENFFDATGSIIGADVSDAGGLQIINKSGTVLPSTGGIGTKLFYGVGGLLVVCAGILLISRKRMNRDDSQL